MEQTHEIKCSRQHFRPIAAMAILIKRHTSASKIRIAERLGMGHDRSVSRLIKQGKDDETIQKQCKALDKSGTNKIIKKYMKNNYSNYGILFALILSLSIHLGAEGFVDPDFRLTPHAPDDPAINTPPRDISGEELADPPPGEIRKLYLYEVNDIRAQYAAKIAAAPDGPMGKDSPLMAKLQAIKADLDKIAKDRLQSDVFALIPKIIALDTSTYDEEGNSQPTYFSGIVLTDLSVGIVHAIAEHVIDQEGNVTADNLLVFTDTMIYGSFLHENRWQDEDKPIDPAGVMIMGPEAVVNHLKSKPWKYADRFLGIWTEFETEPFKRYEASGDGIPALKAKYSANKATINAKWKELEMWMKAQRAADPTYIAPSGE